MKNDSKSLKPRTGRVLVFMVAAPRRPHVTITGCLTTHRPADWSIFTAKACNEEIDRRQAINKLMTDDEQEFFHKYCRLRDD